MAPTTPSGASLHKAPPTGPRALRGPSTSTSNGLDARHSSTPPSSSSGKVSISIPLPAKPVGAASLPVPPARPLNLDSRAPSSSSFPRRPPDGPRSDRERYDRERDRDWDDRGRNGFHSPAESSRNAASSRYYSDRRPRSPSYSRPPSPPSRYRSPEREWDRYPSSRRYPDDYDRSPSPVRRRPASPRRDSRSPKRYDTPRDRDRERERDRDRDDRDSRSSTSKPNDDLPPLRFSLPEKPVVNGSSRPFSSRADDRSYRDSYSSSRAPSPPRGRPPSPPRTRPPSPPRSSRTHDRSPVRVSRPPSPRQRSPPPPPRLPSPPPPPASAPPPQPPSAPRSPVKSTPTPVHSSLNSRPVSRGHSPARDKEAQRSYSTSVSQPASTPPPPPPKPIELPPYAPPPSTSRRPGLGNFVVISDIARAAKGAVKRFDGEFEGEIVKATDARLANDDWKRGRGWSKVRTSYHEVEYEWDSNSVGVKPPPPPASVLITGLNPLTTVDQITNFLRAHGRIREVDSKMDPRSGMQLGICWVKFEGPKAGRPGTAHDVAVQVAKACDGQRISLTGTEKIKVVLDGRGLRAEKAVKEEMARRYPPKPKQAPVPTPKTTAPTPSSGGATPAPKAIPTGPANNPIIPSRPLHSSIPSRPRPPVIFSQGGRTLDPPTRPGLMGRAPPTMPRAGLSSRPAATQHLSSSFVDAPFAYRPGESRAPTSFRDSRGRFDDLRDSYSPRGRSRSRSRSNSHPRSCSTCSSRSSDSEDFRYRRRRSPSPYKGARGRGRGPVRDTKEDEAAVERVKKALEGNGRAYVFIDVTSLPTKSVSDEQLREHFRAFKPIQVLSNHQGWYILFNDETMALRARILDATTIQGHRLVVQIRTAKKEESAATGVPAAVAADPKTASAATGNWRFLTITKKNRIGPPKPAPTNKPSPVVSKVISKDRRRRMSYSSSESESEAEKDEAPPKRSASVASEASDSAKVEVKAAEDEPMPEVKDVTQAKKRAAKPKAPKVSKKARIMSPVLDVPAPSTPPVAEIKLDEPAKSKVAKPKAPKKPSAPTGELAAFLSSGVVQDEEDAYWLGQALAATHEGIEPDLSDAEEEEDTIKEGHPLFHKSGAWRAEGWKKVPQIAKSEFLPERNRAAVSKEDASALASGRTARVSGRRLAHEMETTRKTATAATAESDLFAFNQLRIRKKQLRFSRSPIEGYGLYAMETIHPGEMVCEYVGDICRSAVAEIREQRYLKQGIGSSYLFRIDADQVCDATFCGSVSRLINHSCDPSASAKIISINGQSKIVIYAKKTLHPGQEILYDYKFPLESDPALRVPCLCGAATCRGWLN